MPSITFNVEALDAPLVVAFARSAVVSVPFRVRIFDSIHRHRDVIFGQAVREKNSLKLDVSKGFAKYMYRFISTDYMGKYA